MQHLGQHTTWDIYGCSPEDLSYIDQIKPILNHIPDTIGLGKVQESYKQFEPVGVTGVILLEESHISIHTWPEKGYCAVDLFSCIPFDNAVITDYLNKIFTTDTIDVTVMERGNVKHADACISDTAFAKA